jgi:DNA-binding beta-propeller fold protein YncE
MDQSMKKLIKILAYLIAILVLIAGSVLLYLVFPGTPSRSSSMKFEGYIELPQAKSLNVFDYLTLRDRTLFVTDESSGSVYKVMLDPNTQMADGTVSRLPGGGGVHGVLLMPDENVAFVTRSEENKVDVFDPTNLQLLQSIPVADDADAIVYDPSNSLVYVANGDAHLATLIDPKKRTIAGTISLPGKPEYPALDSKTGLLYQNLTDVSAVAAINLAQRSIVGQWSLAPCEGPSGMAIDSEHRRLFVVCSRNAMLVVFDLEGHKVTSSMSIGGGPDVVAFDAGLHRIYSAGKAGKLTVIQQDGPDVYRTLDLIRTHYGAHTLVVDPVSHRVFVGYASLFNHPRIAVFSPIL